MAEQKSYSQRHGKRTPLAELLPLDTPLVLMVDPSNACNFKCVFCPTGDPALLKSVGRPKGRMDLALFQKLIDDAGAFPKRIKALVLYKDGEPLVNKHFDAMIRYAKQADIADSVETTSNGSLLTAAWAERLVDAGLDLIRISVYGTDDSTYNASTRTRTPFERVRQNVETLARTRDAAGSSLHIHCKILDTGFSDEVKQSFKDAFGPIADSVHIDTLMGWSNTGERDLTLGLAPETGMNSTAPRTRRLVCSEPFMKLAVNQDGSVSVCCVDWAHGTDVGNVRTHSIVDIWNGDALRAFRQMHLEGRRHEHAMCGDCDYLEGLPVSNDLEGARERLLGVY